MVASAISSPAPAKAMISPSIDTLSIGGLSIAVTVGMLAFGPVPFDKHVPAIVPYLLTAGITWPHFLSSYRLLYATRESILTYRRASIYFPAALGAYGLFAVAMSAAHPVHVNLLSLAAGVYLARHYAGQTWGMMASFSHIAGAAFAPRERRICQLSLDVIMVWHIVWAAARGLEFAPTLKPYVAVVDAHVDPLAGVSFVLGAVGLVMMARRTRKMPVRVVVPWLALYGWYALLRRDPTSLVVVQSAHALQYLIFPMRIEETRSGHVASSVGFARAARWLAITIAVGLAAFAGIPALFRVVYQNAGGAGDLSAAFLSVFVSFVNIHHYFIDGCLYKLRNPAVRRDLFAHLQPAAPA
jgi:hypothetical protein